MIIDADSMIVLGFALAPFVFAIIVLDWWFSEHRRLSASMTAPAETIEDIASPSAILRTTIFLFLICAPVLAVILWLLGWWP